METRCLRSWGSLRSKRADLFDDVGVEIADLCAQFTDGWELSRSLGWRPRTSDRDFTNRFRTEVEKMMMDAKEKNE